jgi:C_GCAxxG_C_C family probable redox protein
MTNTELAIFQFGNGFNCAQSVLFAFCHDFGMDADKALKIACGFGAGMGRKQEVCGAVTGGIMVLGLKYGKGVNDAKSATETTYAKTRELMDLFAERHGSGICSRLLNGCELGTEEGKKKFKENDLLNKVCNPCVKSVVEILEAIMK